jgi:hypothetical protein
LLAFATVEKQKKQIVGELRTSYLEIISGHLELQQWQPVVQMEQRRGKE